MDAGITIDAYHLSRTVQKQTAILSDISLHIPQGSLVALLGGSGAGKSTLLYALSGIQPASSGTVLYNHIDYYKHLGTFQSQIGYVPQDESIHRRLTVYKALYYAARLRLPSLTKTEEINQRIEEVLHEVRMTHRTDWMIGKLSGGERKRVAIALELLAQPGVFFLDEPTSGLDPGLDYTMMQLLRELANKGQTIIVVTHTVMNINVCDFLCVLCTGGRLAYFGSPEETKSYFATDNFAKIYELLAPKDENTSVEAQQRFQQSDDYQDYIAQPLAQVQREQQKKLPEAKTRLHAWKQFVLLSQRYIELLKNDTGTLFLLLLQAPIIGFILWGLASSGSFAATSVVTCPTRANIFARTGPIVSIDCQRIVNFLQSPQGETLIQQRNTTKEQALNDAILTSSGTNAQILLFTMGFAAILFGCINGAREIVKEDGIYRRERLVLLGILPYLFSKFVVLVQSQETFSESGSDKWVS